MRAFMLVPVVLLAFSCNDAVNFEGGDPARKMLPVMQASTSEEVQDQSTIDRKLIKTGYLDIVVEDMATAKSGLEKICKKYRAYISSETQTAYDERIQVEQVIRIPAADFDDLIKDIEASAREVKGKNIRTSDVTEEFIDKQARIKTKKELEERYREILKQATKVSDILSIEAQLNQVRADIESMQGRLKYLQDQVAYSTLTLSFYERIGAEFGFGTKTVAAFSNGWDMLLLFLIGMVNIWPFLLLIAGALYVAMRRRPLWKKGRGVSQP